MSCPKGHNERKCLLQEWKEASDTRQYKAFRKVFGYDYEKGHSLYEERRLMGRDIRKANIRKLRQVIKKLNLGK